MLNDGTCASTFNLLVNVHSKRDILKPEEQYGLKSYPQHMTTSTIMATAFQGSCNHCAVVQVK